jgi:3'-phosphoadenosine 5'-phosphosulfate sulfotransferase (PAPS reductase)/FAD synthetase
MNILNYGGGRQTVALCILVAQGRYTRPDRVVIADTSREKTSTWDYLEEVTRPLLATIGLTVEVAPHSLAYVDLYGHNGDLLLPVYTQTGKFSAYCSTEWKARVVQRHLRAQGIKDYTSWIGFAYDERRRIKSTEGRAFPLVDLMLTKADCQQIIRDAGLPMPPPSACWMCPNMGNEEWRDVRDKYPDDFEKACLVDEEVRAEDKERGGSGVWLHASRVPLREADLEAVDRIEAGRPCGLGLCMI